MANYPSEYLYSEEHEWVRVEGDEAVLGITEFAQNQLGDVVFVELPEGGQSFGKGDEIGTIESVKAVAEVYTPVTCEIVESNEAIIDDPEKINDEPHSGGWLVKIKLSNPAELEGLMSAEKYLAFVSEES